MDMGGGDMVLSFIARSTALVVICLIFLIFVKFEVSILSIIMRRSDPYRVLNNIIIFLGIQAILSLSLIISIYYIFSKHVLGDISPQISVTEAADTTEIIEDNESHDTGTTEENALIGLLKNNGYRIGSDMLQIPVIEE